MINLQTGRLGGGNEISVRYALSGALLFDAALFLHIDTDADSVLVINNLPTGNLIQDELLAALSKGVALPRIRDCMEQIFRQGRDLEGEARAGFASAGSPADLNDL